MAMNFRRYAIYFTPPEKSPLARFGATWLGWEIARGQPIAQPYIQGLPARLADITEAPRRYGFHATIKPPFRLAPGTTAEDLNAALARLCDQMTPIALDGLHLAPMGRFLALRPRGETAQLSGLAAAVVETLDSFRAPPEPAELEKRRAARLTARQEALLTRWGYPWVMEEFRFHMTLTGKLDDAPREQVRAVLARRLDGLCPTPFPLDALSLVGEAEDGRFHLIHRHTLSI